MQKIKQTILLCLLCTIGMVAYADEIPNNEIWYTSTDGSVVTPHSSDVFGAKILSNTYTDGKGIIKFLCVFGMKSDAGKDIVKMSINTSSWLPAGYCFALSGLSLSRLSKWKSKLISTSKWQSWQRAGKFTHSEFFSAYSFRPHSGWRNFAPCSGSVLKASEQTPEECTPVPCEYPFDTFSPLTGVNKESIRSLRRFGKMAEGWWQIRQGHRVRQP